jgi:hypothetical protein
MAVHPPVHIKVLLCHAGVHLKEHADADLQLEASCLKRSTISGSSFPGRLAVFSLGPFDIYARSHMGRDPHCSDQSWEPRLSWLRVEVHWDDRPPAPTKSL